ncbi:MAG: hypothetical protein HY543_02610 [Deltaproteobacteria bacterium]|nr:hypothetical protein [Deltaproteobacteria bacterium]
MSPLRRHHGGVAWAALLCGLLCASCLFGANRGPRVLGYRHGTVYLTRAVSYRVGELPEGWRRLRTRARAISFHHAATGATISTDAFCGAAYEDLPLPSLMGHLFAGFPTERIVSTRSMRLAGREALRQVSHRTIDGVPLRFDAVVLKKHECLFDFVLMTPPGGYAQALGTFDGFVNGFAYE